MTCNPREVRWFSTPLDFSAPAFPQPYSPTGIRANAHPRWITQPWRPGCHIFPSISRWAHAEPCCPLPGYPGYPPLRSSLLLLHMNSKFAVTLQVIRPESVASYSSSVCIFILKPTYDYTKSSSWMSHRFSRLWQVCVGVGLHTDMHVYSWMPSIITHWVTLINDVLKLVDSENIPPRHSVQDPAYCTNFCIIPPVDSQSWASVDDSEGVTLSLGLLLGPVFGFLCIYCIWGFYDYLISFPCMIFMLVGKGSYSHTKLSALAYQLLPGTSNMHAAGQNS